jgi:hypothetical protein
MPMDKKGDKKVPHKKAKNPTRSSKPTTETKLRDDLLMRRKAIFGNLGVRGQKKKQ